MKKALVLLFAGVVLAGVLAPTCFAKSHIKTIDMEHHYYIPELFDYLATRKDLPKYDKKTMKLYFRNGQGTGFLHVKSIAADETDNINNYTAYDDIINFGEQRIKNMDKAGVDIAIMSSAALIEELPKEQAIKLAKMSNDRVYELTKKYPDRFMGAAILPTPYVEESIKELKRCKNELGFKYWHTHSNYGSEHLYDKKYEPLLKTAAELNMAIYMHPQYPDDEKFKNLGNTYAGAGLGFGQDTMQTSLRLILNGTFDRYPNLKMIIGHFGEYYPFILERMDNRFAFDDENKNKHEISYYFRNKNIFVTTSGNESQAALRCTKDVIGVDNIMFGSDYPYENYKNMVNVVAKSKVLSKKDKEKILYKNAEKYILNNK